MPTVLGDLAEFERDLIRRRTAEGRERAKARGMRLGRRPKLAPHQRNEEWQRREHGAPICSAISPAVQDKTAHAMLRLIGDDDEPPVALSADERAAIAASTAAAARGELASDEQVRAARAKHCL